MKTISPFNGLQAAAHHYVIFTFRLVHKRTGGAAKPLFFGAPVAVFVRFITPFPGQFQAFLFSVPDLIVLNCKSPDSHISPSLLRQAILSPFAFIIDAIARGRTR
jgi:hypothetical protein